MQDQNTCRSRPQYVRNGSLSRNFHLSTDCQDRTCDCLPEIVRNREVLKWLAQRCERQMLKNRAPYSSDWGIEYQLMELLFAYVGISRAAAAQDAVLHGLCEPGLYFACAPE